MFSFLKKFSFYFESILFVDFGLIFQQLGSPGPKAVLSSVEVRLLFPAPRVPPTPPSGSPSRWKNQFPFKRLSTTKHVKLKISQVKVEVKTKVKVIVMTTTMVMTMSIRMTMTLTMTMTVTMTATVMVTMTIHLKVFALCYERHPESVRG